MIVHIGWDACVDTRELVAVVSADALEPDTEAFLNKMKAEGCFIGCPEGEKSYVLLFGDTGAHVMASCLGVGTLKRRLLSPL